MKKLLLTLLVAVLSLPAFAAIDLTGVKATQIPVGDPNEAMGSGTVDVTSGDYTLYFDGFFNRVGETNLGAMSLGLTTRATKAYFTIKTPNPLKSVSFDLAKFDAGVFASANVTIYKVSGDNGIGNQLKTADLTETIYDADGATTLLLDLSTYNDGLTAGGNYYYVFDFDIDKLETGYADGDAIAIKSVEIEAQTVAAMYVRWPNNQTPSTVTMYVGDVVTGSLAEMSSNLSGRPKFASTNPKVATINAGTRRITAVSKGTTYIYAYALNGTDTIKSSTSYRVNVIAQDAEIEWSATHADYTYTDNTIVFDEASNLPTLTTTPPGLAVKYTVGGRNTTGATAVFADGVLTVTLPTTYQPAADGSDITITATVDNPAYTANAAMTTITLYPQASTLTWSKEEATFYYVDNKFAISGDDALITLTKVPAEAPLTITLSGVSGASYDASTGVVTLPANFKPAADGTNLTIRAAIPAGKYAAATAEAVVTILPTIAWPSNANASYELSFGASTARLPKAVKTEGYTGDVTYTANPKDYVTVAADGTVTLVKVTGEDNPVTITAKSGMTSVSYELTILQGTATLSYSESSVEVVSGASFTAPTLTKSNATVPVKYSSSKPSVATVDAAGNVNIVGVGTTVIKAEISSDNYAPASAQYTLTVIEDLAEGSISLNGDKITSSTGGAVTLAKSSESMTFAFTNVTRNSDGTFTVKENSTIKFGSASNDFIYKYLTVKGSGDDVNNAYTVKAVRTSANNSWVNQDLTGNLNAKLTLDAQSNAFYTITFNKPCSIESIQFLTVTGNVTNNAVANVVYTGSIEEGTINNVPNMKYAVLAQEPVQDGEVFNAATTFFGEKGQEVFIWFDVPEGETLFYAIQETSGNFYYPEAVTWAKLIGTNEEGKATVDYTAVTVPKNPADGNAINAAAATKEGVFRAYAPGSFIDVEKAGTLNYYVSKNGVMSPYIDFSFQNVTGIEDVMVDEAEGEAVYYNLQGVKIANPTPGQVYVRVIGKKADKVVFK